MLYFPCFGKLRPSLALMWVIHVQPLLTYMCQHAETCSPLPAVYPSDPECTDAQFSFMSEKWRWTCLNPITPCSADLLESALFSSEQVPAFLFIL